MNTRSLMVSLVAVGALAACGGDDSTAGNQPAYETVQEGSVAGVTSTIQGPGEAVPALTNTNADTTTAFALDPNAVPAASQMPGGAPPGAASSPSYDPAPTPTYREPESAPRETQPARTATQPSREPERVPPPPTSTASTEPREPEPQPEPQPDPQPEPEPVPPPTTTTEEDPPPPPPTQTDTEGRSGSSEQDGSGIE